MSSHGAFCGGFKLCLLFSVEITMDPPRVTRCVFPHYILHYFVTCCNKYSLSSTVVKSVQVPSNCVWSRWKMSRKNTVGLPWQVHVVDTACLAFWCRVQTLLHRIQLKVLWFTSLPELCTHKCNETDATAPWSAAVSQHEIHIILNFRSKIIVWRCAVVD